MDTILLSPRMPAGVGGRPKKIGTHEHGEGVGQWGFFIGYDPAGKKVLIKGEDFDECMKEIHQSSYKLEWQIKKERRFSQIFFEWLIKKIIPKRLKEQIVENS